MRPASMHQRFCEILENFQKIVDASARGAQVPAVSVLADRGRNTGGRTWQLASAMPIAWGTTDPAVITRAVEEITEGEWALLHDNIGLSEKVRTAKNQQLLIDPADLPDDLR